MTIATLHIPSGIGIAQRITMPVGMSIEEIASATHSTLDGLSAWIRAPEGHATEWLEVPRTMWRWIKPKVADCLMFGFRPSGVFKKIFAVVASIVVSIVAPYLGGVIAGALGFTAGTTAFAVASSIAAAGIAIGASLAINALFPASSPQLQSQSQSQSQPTERAKQFASVESDSNLLAKESYLPVVVGERRIAPPEIAHPFYFLDQGIQAIQRIFAFDGHHAISEVQVERAPISDFPTITTQVRDGAEATPITTFVTKVTRPTQVGDTLSTFSLDETALVDQDKPENSEPQPIRFASAADSKMEEISIRLQIDTFIKSDSATDAIRVPLRLRCRKKGSSDAWFNFPELHLVGRDVSTSLKEFRIRWDNSFGEDGPGGSVQYEFFQRVPAAA